MTIAGTSARNVLAATIAFALLGPVWSGLADAAPGVVSDPRLAARQDAASSQSSSGATPATTTANPTPPAAPLHPFFVNLTLLNSPQSGGAFGHPLNITSIILTNFDTSPQQVFIFAPTFSSGTGNTCDGTVAGGATPNLQVYVQPSQTLVIPFPTPLVIKGLKPNCIAAEVTTLLHGGSIQMDVNGFY